MVRLPERMRLLLVVVGLSLLPFTAAAQDPDAYLARNPILAEVHARDPIAARSILRQLLRIIADETARSDFGGTRSSRREAPSAPPDPDLRDLLAANPLLAEAYRIDPRAALLQLKEIATVTGGLPR